MGARGQAERLVEITYALQAGPTAPVLTDAETALEDHATVMPHRLGVGAPAITGLLRLLAQDGDAREVVQVSARAWGPKSPSLQRRRAGS
ncbi:MAG: hypothetical protein ACRDYX_16915 [Egibacteraceae bacterium]